MLLHVPVGVYCVNTKKKPTQDENPQAFIFTTEESQQCPV